MSIIEREIEKREELIEKKKDAIARATALRAEADEAEKLAASINVDELNAEIEELKGYLHPVNAECESEAVCDEANGDTVADATV